MRQQCACVSVFRDVETSSVVSSQYHGEPMSKEELNDLLAESEKRLDDTREPIDSDFLRIAGDDAFKFSVGQFVTDFPYSLFAQKRKALIKDTKCK